MYNLFTDLTLHWGTQQPQVIQRECPVVWAGPALVRLTWEASLWATNWTHGLDLPSGFLEVRYIKHLLLDLWNAYNLPIQFQILFILEGLEINVNFLSWKIPNRSTEKCVISLSITIHIKRWRSFEHVLTCSDNFMSPVTQFLKVFE